MPVPETAVNKNHSTMLAQHKIGFARKPFGMQPETETKRMECAAQTHFGPGVPRPDSAHHARTGSRINDVGQK